MTPQEIKSLRQRLGLSGSKMALLMGVHTNTVYLWELGKKRPSGSAVKLLERLAAEDAAKTPQGSPA